MIDLAYIKDEMMVHIPICTHKEPSKVLVLGDMDLDLEINKHSCIKDVKSISSNFMDSLSSMETGSFDIIINSIENLSSDKALLDEVVRVLSPKGVISSESSNMLSQAIAFENELKAWGDKFKIVMPYKYEASQGAIVTSNNLLLLSHTYHPTADINLQRADLTDGLKYYNSDIAIGAFHLSTVIRKRFLGLVKL
ncbi:MAG: hypothetical protein IE878_04795 [Epsilonproteobacteria bacterium]|nr:hypothetical protein [Campylobacterota bacterium]MBD3839690.1 hypothetical protein [Campylobacterota bacterium]